MPEDFNQQIIKEFRANRGQVSGPFGGGRLLLLTTTGARTGASHTTPVAYLPDGERQLIIASAGGAPSHPAWYHNLLANPRVTVEDGIFTYEADAIALEGEERDRVFARAAEANPGWAAYQAKTARVIPVVALHPIGPPPVAGSPADFLKAVHDAFRRELALVRKEVAASGRSLGAQLRVNCLTVCQGLHHHHSIEEAYMFPTLGERHPELSSALARLREEHQTIKRLVDELQELLSGDGAEAGTEGGAGADPATVLAEVERLTAEVEAHLDNEEEHLLPVLHAFTP
ncbi:nitroreductase/quinone reductase family protein [Sphaerisporangium dianthi]|uniref:Nitroreductase/quinone reductase family protein n=1 Tax=Sphaerisporangium dianthi TaxID=1436120 RepID=A0ABV9CNC6_9ACTN